MFLKIGGLSSSIEKSLSLVEKQEEKYRSIVEDSVRLNDHIVSLKLGLPFLDMFHRLSASDECRMCVDSVVEAMIMELHSVSEIPIDGSLSYQSVIQCLDCEYNKLRQLMKNAVVQPETEEFDMFLKHSYHHTGEGFLKRMNDFLLETLRDLSSSKADVVHPSLGKELEGIKEVLISLQPLSTYLTRTLRILEAREDPRVLAMEYSIECGKMLKLITLLGNVAYLLYNCSVEETDEEMGLLMARKLSDLTEKTNVEEMYVEILKGVRSSYIPMKKSLFQPLHNLKHLLDCNAKYLSDPSKKLDEHLQLLLASMNSLPHLLNLANMSYLLMSVEAIIRKSVPVLYSCRVAIMKEDATSKANNALSEVLHQLKFVEENAGHVQLYDNCPKTDGVGFLKRFLGRLEELIMFWPEWLGVVKDQVHILHVEFASTVNEINEQSRDLLSRVVCLGYQAEYVIDLYLIEHAICSHVMCSLSEIIKQIKLIKEEAERFHLKEECHHQAHDIAKARASHFTLQASDFKADDDDVGFEDQAREIMEFLVADSKRLELISIVGMAGAGKTTLAKRMYKDRSIMEHFDVKAWCTVSQTYQRRELLLTVLRCIVTVIDDREKLTDEELAAILWKSLKMNRYLIVIDDMWDIAAWNDMKRCFPDDNNCSRILVTTRHESVVSNTKVVHLRQLTDVEGWVLFQKTLKREHCSSDPFQTVGRRIVQSCKGLPLSIIVVAGLLSKVEASVQEWEKIAGSLRSQILMNSENSCMGIIELSYNHLPDHLKPCFLYFGAFAEDELIHVQSLKRLWISEGLVSEKESSKVMEDVAEEYLKDLISRSLVILTRERSLGGVKACRIHDILHEFCQAKAKQESFLQLVKADHFSKLPKAYDQRRLIIHSQMSNLTIAAAAVGLRVRSLLHTSPESRTSLRWDISFLFENFKLLTILKLPSVQLDTAAFLGITSMIHLKYLATQFSTAVIPSTISNLWNLEYLLLECSTSAYTVEVPDSLWDLKKLRALSIRPFSYMNVHVGRLNDSLSPSFLENLSTVMLGRSVSCEEDEVMFLSKMPKLRKLVCSFWRCTWDESAEAWQFPELDSLYQLVSLHVHLRCDDYWAKGGGGRCELKFPPNLEKLSLSRCRVPWEDISRIGNELSNLKVLKLDDVEFWKGKDGYSKAWDMDGDVFPELRYLKLRGIEHLHWWFASEDSFPKLEQLVVDWCWGLEEIPSCLGGVYTLRMITLESCRKSVYNSARVIQREQADMGNEEFVVNIHDKRNIRNIRNIHDIHNIHKMKKLVLKLNMYDEKIKQKAMKMVSGFAGVLSISVDVKRNKMTVIGEDVDAVKVLQKLQKLCYAEMISLGPAIEEK